jgi:murein DD-endopeptidase MepM/ murein hydrolase activator NlpD
MSSVDEKLRALLPARAMVLTLIAVGAAGCSMESTRFNENPFHAQNEAPVPVRPSQAAPVGRIESQSLPPTAQMAPAAGQPAMVAAPPGGVAGGGTGMAAYSPPQYNSPPYSPPAYGAVGTPETTGTVTSSRAAAAARHAPGGRWNLDGGTAVVIAQGDTVESIARRHHVPAHAIVQANNLKSPNSIQPGQHLVVPRFTKGPTPATAPVLASATSTPHQIASNPTPPRQVPPRPAPMNASAESSGPVHVVAAGDTLGKIARHYDRPLADVAKANNLAPTAKIRLGERIVIPGGSKSASAQQPKGPAAAKPPAAAAAPAPANSASIEPPEHASMVTPSETPASSSAAKPGDTTPTFRWPVRGRVITGYGPKPNGQQNDGINVAVPENTPIKAAEDGVVAYSGNELKGYGNLVLVRHPNGYVTAYAHAKELLVKRGDQIKRGQIIAKSGQTGSVDAPQVHFEIRKGPSPVDPLPFLNGA